MSQKEIIAKLVKQYIQIQSIEEEVKEIKAQAKASGLNASIISQVAKAIASNKVEELKEKSEEVLDAIEESRS
jgi:uncharacterized protein (UPF0335 family)